MTLQPVHADGGYCHGTPLDESGTCPKCGITPDMQSIEMWDAPVRTLEDALEHARYWNTNGDEERVIPPETFIKDLVLLANEVHRLRADGTEGALIIGKEMAQLERVVDAAIQAKRSMFAWPQVEKLMRAVSSFERIRKQSEKTNGK